jgi:hypothetical protein
VYQGKQHPHIDLPMKAPLELMEGVVHGCPLEDAKLSASVHLQNLDLGISLSQYRSHVLRLTESSSSRLLPTPLLLVIIMMTLLELALHGKKEWCDGHDCVCSRPEGSSCSPAASMSTSTFRAHVIHASWLGKHRGYRECTENLEESDRTQQHILQARAVLTAPITVASPQGRGWSGAAPAG